MKWCPAAGLVALALVAGCRADDVPPEDSPAPVARPGAAQHTWVGEPLTLDGSASEGAQRYQWNFGNGQGWPEPRDEAVATVTYETPGRYQAVLTVFSGDGRRHSASVMVTATRRPIFEPRYSSSLTAIPGTDDLALVVPDANELLLLRHEGEGNVAITARFPTAANPRTVSVWGEWLAVVCQDADVVQLVHREDGAQRREVTLPYGSRPFGAAETSAGLFVSLQGTGQLAQLAFEEAEPVVLKSFEAITDARGVASLPDGRVAVSRWRSPDDRAEIAVVDPRDGSVSLWTMRYDTQFGSDVEIGGIPSYLNQVLVTPDGTEALVPALHANHRQGLFLDGRPHTFESMIGAVMPRIDVASGTEQFERRQQFNDRGFASAGAFTSRGDFLFLAMRGNRTVERVDVLTGTWSGTINDVGFAPDGLALSSDDRFLFVDASLSRELVVFDVTDFSSMPRVVSRVRTVEQEPLDSVELRGKQLFNDSADRRLGKDGYMACAHCHLDGETDNRVWDFTHRGEGLRNTTSLVGRAGMGDGPVHWSANFDEIQDFENDIRNEQDGTGLLADHHWNEGNRSHPLGLAKAGLSEDLDALAVYVSSLATQHRSPYRNADGSLTAAAARGKVIFESELTGCTSCHTGARLTDSGFMEPAVPRLHDVGTLGEGSGQRLGGALLGIDTPTLHGLWDTAPYLHDGSAETVLEVLTSRNEAELHGATSHLAAEELGDLVEFLLSLDGRTD